MMLFSSRVPAARLAGELWELDLAAQSAQEAAWATGRPPSRSFAGWAAADAGSELGAVAGKLGRRAGGLCGTRPWWRAENPDAPTLNELADMPESDAVVAAAALRVFDGPAHTEDSESLQPGAELPAVGWYARWASP